MCCSSTAAKSPMAEYLKSHSPQALWKASLRPDNPFKPQDPAKADPVNTLKAANPPGVGGLIDTSA